jgi:hypothetical protein
MPKEHLRGRRRELSRLLGGTLKKRRELTGNPRFPVSSRRANTVSRRFAPE